MSDVLGRVLRLIWHKRDTLRFLNYISWLDNKPTLWLKGRYEYDNKVIIILPHQCSVGVPVTWKIRCKIKATYCLEKESILRTVKEKNHCNNNFDIQGGPQKCPYFSLGITFTKIRKPSRFFLHRYWKFVEFFWCKPLWNQ